MIEELDDKMLEAAMEVYREFDEAAPDGIAKDIIAHLVWHEMLDDVLVSDAMADKMIQAEESIRERFIKPPRKITFEEWYESKIGVPVACAERAGVYDLPLLREAWNYNS
jgi:hypothetical protein